MTTGGNVDPRYAQVMEEILRREWIVKMQLSQAQVARMLGVSRMTVRGWLTGKSGIAKATAWQFKDELGLRGFFARRVLEIHQDHQQKMVDRLFGQE